jgi:uncharacterized membrane protein
MDYPTIDLAADSRPFQRQATRASVIAVMTAACIVSNYLLIGVFNVKLMDLIVFSSGFLFGPSVGASVGILTWLVYGTLNPYGFSLPVLVATSLMESVYGIVGGIIGKRGKMGVGLTSNLKYGIIGFLLTFLYDLVTNIVSGLSAGIPLGVALITGIPFAIAHEGSNAAFFFLGASPLISAVGRLIPNGGKDG